MGSWYVFNPGWSYLRLAKSPGLMRGDGRRHQAHEAVKLVMQRLVLSCPDPVGCAFPKESILIDEPAHLRQDKSRPGDIYAMGTGL
jgi:hypothetical protein